MPYELQSRQTPMRSTPSKASLSLALVLIAFALRVLGLDAQSLWRDEVDALRFAIQPMAQLRAMFVQPGQNGPLFYLLLRPWILAAGQSEFALRFPSALAGTLAIPLVVAVGRELRWPRAARRLAALLVATHPYLIWYSQEAKMYALLVVVVLCSQLSLLRALRLGGWRRWILYWLFTTLSFYLHVLAALLLLVEGLWFLLWRPRAWTRWAGFATAMAGLTLPYLPMARWQIQLWLSPQFAPGFPFIPLDQIITILLLAFSRGLYPSLALWPVLPSLFLALSPFWLPIPSRQAGRRELAAVLLWLILPIVSLYAISLRVPLFTDRYLIWIAPAFLLLTALGAWTIVQLHRGLGMIVTGAVLALYLVATVYQANTPIKADFRRATAWIESRRAPGDAVMLVIPYLRYTYDYYAQESPPFIEPPYTQNGMTDEEVARIMAERLAGHCDVWWVASEEESWDRRRLARSWLEAHARLLEGETFARVEVRHYRLNRCGSGELGS